MVDRYYYYIQMIRNITLILLLLSGLLFILHKNFPDILSDKENLLHILQIVLVLSLVLVGVSRKSMNASFILKGTAIWLFIALAVISGYSYRFAFKDYYYTILGNVFPSMAIQQGEGQVTFRADAFGHFKIRGNISGQSINFLLDTGATKVALTAADAKRIGFNLDALDYGIRVSTANGIALFAPVIIPEIKIGDISVRNVSAYVSKSKLDTSLLGMSFLTRLREYEVSQNTLTLKR